MKYIILLAVIIFSSCAQNDGPRYISPTVDPPVATPTGAYHEVRIDPNTGQQVVYVQQADGTNYFIDYLLFNQLFNSGGYGSVYGYYNTHTTYIRSYSTRYVSYQPSTRYYGKQRDNTFRPSSPSNRPTTFRPSSPRSGSSSGGYRPSSPSSRPSGGGYRPSSPSSGSSSSFHSGRR